VAPSAAPAITPPVGHAASIVTSSEVALDSPVVLPRLTFGQTPAIAFDGSNYLVAWYDSSTIRAVRVRTDGTVLDFGGIVVAQGAVGNGLAVTFDGAQYIVAWIALSPVSRLMYRRVGLDGTLRDANAVPLSYGRLVSGIASTSSGISLVVWDGGFATRIDSSGTVLDPSPIFIAAPTAIPLASSAVPAVASDGSSFFVAWLDARTNPVGDVHGRLVGSDGSLGTETAIATGTFAKAGVRVARGGGRTLVTWIDSRADAAGDVWGALLDATGSLVGTAFPVDVAPGRQSDACATWTGSDFLVAWNQPQGAIDGVADVRARHISIAGVVSDPAIVIAANLVGPTSLALGSDAAGTAFAAWFDEPFLSVGPIVGSRIAGDVVVDAPGIPLLKGDNNQQSPAVASDGTDYLVVWADDRSNQGGVGPGAIYGAIVGADGAVTSPGTFHIADDYHADVPPHVVYGHGEYLVTWSYYNILVGARVGRDGTILGSQLEFVGDTGFLGEWVPAMVAYDPTDQLYLLTWSYGGDTEPNNGEAMMVHRVESIRLDANGGWLAPILDLSVEYHDAFVRSVAFDGTNFVVAWDERQPATDIFATRIAPDGTMLDPVGGFALSTASSTRSSPALALDGTRMLATWSDSRNGGQVYATWISGGGVGDPNGFPISAATRGREPDIAGDGAYAAALWTAGRGDLDASWVAADGSVLYESGIPVATRVTSSSVASDGNGHALVAYGRHDSAGAADRLFVKMVTFDHGTTCTSATECGGGPCIDGYCCDTTCGGGDPSDCVACSVAAGGLEEGHCTASRTVSGCASCGNSVIDPGEQCDDGPANNDAAPDACRTSCTFPRCGDGVVDIGELCDDGAANSDSQPNACRTTCRTARCNDGVIDTGEQCDNGALDTNVADACRRWCWLPRCGDAIVDSGEQCDTGASNSNGIPNACRLNCVVAHCGDGVVDSSEQCDDGNVTNGDGCSSTCMREADAGVPDAGIDAAIATDAAPDASPVDAGVVDAPALDAPADAATPPDAGTYRDAATADASTGSLIAVGGGGCACDTTGTADPSAPVVIVIAFLMSVRRRRSVG
jgi:cysteine-rich repeat protein